MTPRERVLWAVAFGFGAVTLVPILLLLALTLREQRGRRGR